MRSTLRSLDTTATRMTTVALVTLAAACGDQSAPTSPARTVASGAALGKGFTPNGPNSLPARGRIAFASNLTGTFQIYTANEDGTGLLRITYSSDADNYPVWSPDGRKIAFIKATGGTEELYVVNADGSSLKKLTSLGRPKIMGLTWAPDSRRIAFSLMQTDFSEFDIYVVGAGGGSPAQLTSDPGQELYPAWSPDGTRIAYSNGEQIVFMNPDGSNATLFQGCQTQCFQPAWSPDGTKLAWARLGAIYVGTANDPSDIVTLVASNAISPQWAPDGVKLVYTDWTFDTVYTIDANGGNAQPLILNTSSEMNPSWGRQR